MQGQFLVSLLQGVVGHFPQWTGKVCFVASGDVDSHGWALFGSLVHQGLWHSGTLGSRLEAHVHPVIFCSSREELAGGGRDKRWSLGPFLSTTDSAPL